MWLAAKCLVLTSCLELNNWKKFTPSSECPSTFYPADFPGEKIEAKSVPGQAVNLPVTKCLTREISAANERTPERIIST